MVEDFFHMVDGSSNFLGFNVDKWIIIGFSSEVKQFFKFSLHLFFTEIFQGISNLFVFADSFFIIFKIPGMFDFKIFYVFKP